MKVSSVPKQTEFHTPVAILRRLDIDPEEVASAPKITESLQSCFGKFTKGNPREQIINYLAVSDAPEARAFLKSWRGIAKSDTERLSIEAVCVHALVSPLAVFGAIVMAARNLKGQESALKAILAHPDVIDSTVLSAKLIGPAGHADRKILHEAVGFLPTRKGSEVEINFFGKKADKNDDSSDDDEEAWDDAFPSISGNLEKWSENRRAITDGK